MSENSSTLLNLTESFQVKENFSAPPNQNHTFDDANKIFELINQLNNTIGFENCNNNNSNGKHTTSSHVHTNGHCEDDEEEGENIRNSIQPLEMNTNTTNAPKSTKIPRMNFLHQSKPSPPLPTQSTPVTNTTTTVLTTTSNHNLPTKIPTFNSNSIVISNGGNAPPTVANTVPQHQFQSKLQAPTSYKDFKNNHQQQQQQQQQNELNSLPKESSPPPLPPTSKMRAPRSVSRTMTTTPTGTGTATSGGIGVCDETTASSNNMSDGGGGSSVRGKRGVSLSNAPKAMKTTRSMSINDSASKENLDDSASVISSEGKKSVRYIVRHKPRESQVKIFSQKVEIKNVASKIGSLEKAATYTPSGGNVKIESHKLSWNARSKIGSLDYVDHKPKGGNIRVIFFIVTFTLRPTSNREKLFFKFKNDHFLTLKFSKETFNCFLMNIFIKIYFGSK